MALPVHASDSAPMDKPQPFEFSRLPPETQLRILEHTDLIGPTRRFVWNPTNGFGLPALASRKAIRGSWRSPRSLFLVNRTFYRHAIDIFYRRNEFYIAPDTRLFVTIVKPGEPSPMPTRYATSQFFSDHLSVETIPKIRSLDFEIFGHTREGTEESARQDWFDSISRAAGLGLKLSSLHVSMFGSEELEWEALNARAPSDEDKIAVLRGYVHHRVWPLTSSGAHANIPKHLMVQIRTETALWRYEIRAQGGDDLLSGEQSHQEARRKKWGSPDAVRLLHLQDTRGDKDEEADSDDEATIWQESVWAHKLELHT